MSARTRGFSGFSLIEMMTAVVILGIGIAVLIQALSGTLQAQRRIDNRQIAAQLLQGKVAEYLTQTGAMDSKSGDYPAPYQGYHWQAAIVPTKVQGVFALTVDVEWAGRSGSLKLSAQSLVPQR